MRSAYRLSCTTHSPSTLTLDPVHHKKRLQSPHTQQQPMPSPPIPPTEITPRELFRGAATCQSGSDSQRTASCGSKRFWHPPALPPKGRPQCWRPRSQGPSHTTRGQEPRHPSPASRRRPEGVQGAPLPRRRCRRAAAQRPSDPRRRRTHHANNPTPREAHEKPHPPRR